VRLDLHRIGTELNRRGVKTAWNPEGVHRGREINPRPEAIILHDTVTTRAWTTANVWRLLTHGRAGLPGPLANLSPDRAGVVWLVANGRANHNGFGDYDNDTIGVEVQCAGGLKGHEEPWNPVQQDVTVTLCQVLESIYGNLPILGHKESDPGRKIDPWGIDMHAIRHRIDHSAPLPATAVQAQSVTPTTRKVPTMFTFWHYRAVYSSNGVTRSNGHSPEMCDALEAIPGFPPRQGQFDKPSVFIHLPVAK
jgi:hypothetical protein